MAKAKRRRVHLRVRGKVQGVFFRASVQEEAARLGVVGWVRNRSDGSVELLAEGGEGALQMLCGICRDGPGRAEVVELEASWEAASGDLRGFNIAPTR